MFSDFSTRAVSRAGDVNGDGFDDIVFISGSDNGQIAIILFGKAGDFEPTLNILEGPLPSDTGFKIAGDIGSVISLDGAGDINGDGFDDLVTGTYYGVNDDFQGLGKSFIVFGFNTGAFDEVGTTGNDAFTGNARQNKVALGQGDDVFSTGAGDDLVDGGAGDDRGALGDGDDTAHGGAGNDLLKGDSGNDALYGEAGNDRLLLGAGEYKAFGGDGDDLSMSVPMN